MSNTGITPEQVKEAHKQMKAVFEEGIATINGRDYKLTPMTHSERVKVFSFYASPNNTAANQSFEFLDDPKYKEVEKVMFNRVTFEDMQLSKLPKHFEEYPEDYITLISTAMGVMSYPFLKGVSGK